MNTPLMPAGRLSSILGGAKVTFDPFRDAKVAWIRTGDELKVRVSDHFLTAPDVVLDALGRCIMRSIAGDDSVDKDYGLIDTWMMSSAYRESNREIYLERSRLVDTERDAGKLYEAYDWLSDIGRVNRITDLKLFWASVPEGGKPSRALAEASTVMRVVSVNPELADPSKVDLLEDVIADCIQRMSVAIAEGMVARDVTHSLVLGGDIRCEPAVDREDKEEM